MSRLVTARPYVTIGALVAITIVLGAGVALRAELDETDGYFPRDSAVARALDQIDELFGESGEISVVTLLFKGEALTPGGLAQMATLIDEITADPALAALLAPDDPIAAPSLIIEAALQLDSLESLSQAQVDAAQGVPEIGRALAVMTGTDTDGTAVAIATLRLRDTGDERTPGAERRVYDIASAAQGPLLMSSVSKAVIEDEYQRSYREDISPLIGAAFLLIAGLLFLLLRSPSDLLLSLAGLFMAIIWIVGSEGWLGPNGLGLLGRPSGISVIIPIVIISLTVDYAIQVALHYREARIHDTSALAATRSGLRTVTVPVALAALTTIASFMVGLFSPIPAIGDFGVVAGPGGGRPAATWLRPARSPRDCRASSVSRMCWGEASLASPRSISSAYWSCRPASAPPPRGSSPGSASSTSCPGTGASTTTSRRSMRPSAAHRKWPMCSCTPRPPRPARS